MKKERELEKTNIHEMRRQRFRDQERELKRENRRFREEVLAENLEPAAAQGVKP